jgi:hypothetical protein
MPNVLTVNSTVGCGHPPPPPGSGVVQVRGEAKLRVAGGSVLLLAGVNGRPVSSACGIQPATGFVKCTQVNSVSGGLATKLTVGSLPVVLSTLTGGTNGTVSGTPQVLLAAVANQDKLRSV